VGDQRLDDRKLSEDDRKRIEGVESLVWRNAHRDTRIIRLTAEEIAAEYFLALCQTMHRYNPTYAYTTFAVWVIMRRRSDIMRSYDRSREAYRVPYDEKDMTAADPPPSLYDRDELEYARKHTTELNWRILTLRYMHGMDYISIAAATGVTKNSAIKRVKHTKMRLRQVLENVR
jgi:RNA polymerase sigma factor (sigma-70 family)